MEVRWRLFPFTIWSQGFRSGHQVWWQVPLLASCSHGSGTVSTQVGGVVELFSIPRWSSSTALGCVQFSCCYAVWLLSAACLKPIHAAPSALWNEAGFWEAQATGPRLISTITSKGLWFSGQGTPFPTENAFSQIEPCLIVSLFLNPVPSVFCLLSFLLLIQPFKNRLFSGLEFQTFLISSKTEFFFLIVFPLLRVTSLVRWRTYGFTVFNYFSTFFNSKTKMALNFFKYKSLHPHQKT